MNWYTPDKEFLNYLREKDKRIPNTDYGDGKYKPFFGELFEVDGLVYITQVSHPKDRHKKMKNSKDFLKVYDDKDNFIAVINLNYMFPIQRELLEKLDYQKININNDANNYISLLKKELKAIDKMEVDEKAKYIYNLKCNYPNNKISKRCLDFKALEEHAKKYNKA